jgi:preprotein translocase subunit SecG
MLSLFISFLLSIHVIVSLLIIFIVLMQRPKSEGLGAAFGGGMTENLFGAQTSNVLANATRWLGAIFFILTLILSVLYAKQSTQRSSIQAAAIRAAAAAAAAAASPSAAPLSGTAAVTGTALPAASPASAPAPTAPASSPLPAPALNSSPAPASSPAAGGTSGH